jgi:hypothetical protein
MCSFLVSRSLYCWDACGVWLLFLIYVRKRMSITATFDTSESRIRLIIIIIITISRVTTGPRGCASRHTLKNGSSTLYCVRSYHYPLENVCVWDQFFLYTRMEERKLMKSFPPFSSSSHLSNVWTFSFFRLLFLSFVCLRFKTIRSSLIKSIFIL